MYYFNVMDTTLKEIELIDKSIKKTFMMILDEIVAIIFIKINFQNLFSFNILHGWVINGNDSNSVTNTDKILKIHRVHAY